MTGLQHTRRTVTEALLDARERVGGPKTILEDHDRTTLTYDRLILAPGAKPLVPPIPGVDLPGVYRMRDLPDTDAIKAHVDGGAAKRARKKPLWRAWR